MAVHEDVAIERMSVHLVGLPVHTVHSQGSGDVASIRSVILELVTNSGVVGWGEAAPWSVFTGTMEASASALHNYLRPEVLGANPLRVASIMTRADQVIVDANEAKAALETALLDIVGKLLGVPVAELFGGRCRDRIPLSFSVADRDFDRDLEQVAAMYEDGLRILKVKTGFAGRRFDLMRLEKLRSLYSDVDLRVDYNQSLQPYEALPRLRDLEAFHLSFIEQPVPRADRTAMADLTRALDTPLMADESIFGVHEAFLCAQQRVADVFSLKIMKSGGIRRALEVAAIARAAGIAVYGGCMFETGVAQAAGAHLCAAVESLPLGCEFYMPTYYLKEDILSEPFPVRHGKVLVPKGPGLGVEVDRDKLQRFQSAVMR